MLPQHFLSPGIVGVHALGAVLRLCCFKKVIQSMYASIEVVQRLYALNVALRPISEMELRSGSTAHLGCGHLSGAVAVAVHEHRVSGKLGGKWHPIPFSAAVGGVQQDGGLAHDPPLFAREADAGEPVVDAGVVLQASKRVGPSASDNCTHNEAQ